MRSERTPAGVVGWVWRGSATLGGCVVEVLGPGRSRFWTSLTDPATVIAFEAMDDIALRGLARLFGSAWYDRVSADAPGASDVDRWAPPSLEEAWQRVAVVEGVEQWWPRPIDADLVTIDRALALHRAGARGLAAVTIATCSGRVVELRAAALTGALPPTAADIVADAADLVIDALVEGDEDRSALLTLAESVAYEATPSDYAALDAFREETQPPVALTLGTIEALDAAVDLVCVSPRVVLWKGPDAREIAARADADTGLVDVVVPLAPGSDPESAELAELVAYLADASTGEILATSALQPTDALDEDAAELSATVPLGGRSPDTIVVGIYQANIGIGPDVGVVGRALARLNRLLVATWEEARRWQARGESAPDRRAQVANAVAALSDAERTSGPGGAEHRLARAACAQADDLGVLRSLRPDLSPAGQAQRPLLAELLDQSSSQFQPTP